MTGHGTRSALMRLNTDTFLIPFQDRRIIYRPRRRLAFIGNEALADYLASRAAAIESRNGEIEQFLEAVGYDLPGLVCPPVEIPPDGFRPAAAVLLMTNRCNLRCVYCYANAGDEPHAAEMSWPIAKALIDYVQANAQRTDGEIPSLTFHGGGEPAVCWDLMRRCVEYAHDRNPDTHVSMSSNGVWTGSQREFICRNFQSVSLSMDGTPGVQNEQRPLFGGGESSPAVMESIHALDACGMDYGIRMTVLPGSVDQLVAGVEFICENSRARTIQIEPTFTSVRGQYADVPAAFADAFIGRFMEAWRIGKAFGRQVYYSGARPWVIAPMFCQAPLKAAVAAADGRLVTCFEVFSESSPFAGSFTVGRVSDAKVEFDHASLQAYLDKQQQRRRECEGCFCYWHCCGDCATRRPDMLQKDSGRCRVTRGVTRELLLEYMEEGDGVWQGLLAAPPGAADCDYAVVGDSGDV